MSLEPKDEIKSGGPTIKKLSTLFFFSHLLGFSGQIAKADEKLKIVSSDTNENPFDLTCPTNPFFDPAYHIATATTPIVSDPFLSHFIVGSNSQAEHQRIISAIQKIRQINSSTKKTIDLVLRHLPGFSIAIYDAADLRGSPFVATFNTGTRCLQIRREDLNSAEVYINLLHEFRHALWLTLHNLEGRESKIRHNPYLADTDIAKEEFAKILEEGDKNAEEIRNQLKLESWGTISPENRQKLAAFRKGPIKREYDKYYRHEIDIESGIFLPDAIEKQLGRKPYIGANFIWDDLGQVTIKKIYPKQSNGQQAFDLAINDHLNAVVYWIQRDVKNVKKGYRDSQQNREREAHLFGHIPRIFLEKFFPQLVGHTDRLIHKMDAVLPTQIKTMLDYLSFMEQESVLKREMLKDPEEYDPQLAPYYITWAREAISIHDYSAAKSGLEKLLAHKNRVPEAHLELARIYYQETDYIKSTSHYSNAEKAGITLSNQDLDNYRQAKEKAKEMRCSAAKEAGISEEEFNSEHEQCSLSP